MGKICIINTLITSQIMHKLAILPFPTESFIKKYKHMILSFLWGNGVHKISYEKLTQDYPNGELRLFDIQKKAIAMKAKWCINFREREELWFYGSNLDYRVWQYNISKKDVAKVCQGKQGTIFKQILESWCTVNFKFLETAQEICSQRIWANSCIRRANAPFLENKWLNSPLEFLYQLRHEDGTKLRTWPQIVEIHGKYALKWSIIPWYHCYQLHGGQSLNMNMTRRI